ncbi:MAG TPA: dephospho-CoA kinase [Planctomycetota bacterium]|nr:dephospho-CoA kinase [Planctomycetota bacterium]
MSAEGKRKKIVIGLIGEVCAGKSTVADSFRRHGAQVYDADKHVHEIYRQPEAIEQVRKMFGPEVLDAQGQVDRKALGQIVFNDPTRLKKLTKEIIFPRTTAAMKEALEQFHKSDAQALLLDAPTLFEAGRDDLCHYIVYVTAPMERRLAWAKTRGWDEQELKQREARLARQSVKKRRADLLIDNKGTIEDIDRSVSEKLREWTAVHK